MATLDQTLTTAWTDIKSSLSLTDGTTYTVDNLSSSIVYIREAASEPAADAEGPNFRNVYPREITPSSGLNMYARAASGTANIALTES